jgi:P pilus assembly chaperone PapD
MSPNKIFLILICTLFCRSISAQQADAFYLQGGKIIADGNSKPTALHLNEINIKALRHVAKKFDDPENQFWVITKQGYRVKFEKDSVVYWIDYYKNGAWRNTLMSYKVDRAPQNVLWTLRGYLNDYNVTQISEIQYGNTTAYFVNLVGFKSLKTVRIMDGDLELMSNFKKGVTDSLPIAYGAN